MNHKRGKPKTARAGCLMCKPNKVGHGKEYDYGHRQFANLRREAASNDELHAYDSELCYELGYLMWLETPYDEYAEEIA